MWGEGKELGADPEAAQLPSSCLSGVYRHEKCGEWARASVSSGTESPRQTKWLLLLQLIFEGRLDSVYSDSANGLRIFMAKPPTEVCLEPKAVRVVTSRHILQLCPLSLGGRRRA